MIANMMIADNIDCSDGNRGIQPYRRRRLLDIARSLAIIYMATSWVKRFILAIVRSYFRAKRLYSESCKVFEESRYDQGILISGKIVALTGGKRINSLSK